MRCRIAAFLCVFAAIVGSSGGASSLDVSGADQLRYGIIKTPDGLEIRVLGAGVDRPDQAVYVALRSGGERGAAMLPSEQGFEGSAVWLPFQADTLLMAKSTGDAVQTFMRRWKSTQWGAREEGVGNFTATVEPAQMLLRISQKILGKSQRVDLAVYVKDLTEDKGMGRFYGAMDQAAPSGTGERMLRNYLTLEFGPDRATFTWGKRLSSDNSRVRIYQLLPRLFGNTNTARVPNGTFAQNGSGKFSDLNDVSLAEIKAMGFTHIGLTGVIRHATGTAHAAVDLPADDPDVLKGVAGNPFAIRDYFDVSPDYAEDPGKRLDEFKAMVGRIHDNGMKVLLDFVPNHVARGYHSVAKPESDFGADDDRTKFFDPQNNFFYLETTAASGGGTRLLRLPTTDGDGRPTSPTALAMGGADGAFAAESVHGRVTGNNLASWSPGADDWYDTVKLNYGWDFSESVTKSRIFPHADKPEVPIPDTWMMMDEVLAWWQGMGVDGFRVDHASMVPPEFWRWLITRANERNSDVAFIAHTGGKKDLWVPDGDSSVAAVTKGDAGMELLNAGFAAVELPTVYEAVRRVYAQGGAANDIDRSLPRPFVFDNMVLYGENHETLRLASRSGWGGHGAVLGRAVSALIFGLSCGPVSLYHGQEVGEPAEGAEGFSGDDGRTTIYDYWSMPEFAKWINGGKFDGGLLSDEQRALRDFYRNLLAVIDQPAFRYGEFYPLNPDNLENKSYGGAEGAPPGRWLYTYLRYDAKTGQRMLVVVNLHPSTAMENVRIMISPSAMRFLGWDALIGSTKVIVSAADRLGRLAVEAASWAGTPAEMENPGVHIKKIPALTPAYYELSSPLLNGATDR